MEYDMNVATGWQRHVGFPVPGVVAHYRRPLPDGREEHLRLYNNGSKDHHIDYIPALTHPVAHAVFEGVPFSIAGGVVAAKTRQPAWLVLGVAIDLFRAWTAGRQSK